MDHQQQGPADITRLLVEWRSGDPQAFEKLTPLLYDELRKLAASYMRRERSDHTLQPTALVHEAYLRIAQLGNLQWEDRAHFFGIAAHLMRQILVQYARSNSAKKRGGAAQKLSLADELPLSQEGSREVIALDDGLKDLEKRDPRKSKIVELKYFGGLTVEEIGEVLKISPATIGRELRLAMAMLYRMVATAPAEEA